MYYSDGATVVSTSVASSRCVRETVVLRAFCVVGTVVLRAFCVVGIEHAGQRASSSVQYEPSRAEIHAVTRESAEAIEWMVHRSDPDSVGSTIATHSGDGCSVGSETSGSVT